MDQPNLHLILLLLCVTGLPLLFKDEIDGFLNPSVETAAIDRGTVSRDKMVSAGLARKPGWAVQFVL